MERSQKAMQNDILKQQAELNERHDSSAKEHVNSLAKNKSSTQPSQKRSYQKVNKTLPPVCASQTNLSLTVSQWNNHQLMKQKKSAKEDTEKENEPVNAKVCFALPLFCFFILLPEIAILMKLEGKDIPERGSRQGQGERID